MVDFGVAAWSSIRSEERRPGSIGHPTASLTGRALDAPSAARTVRPRAERTGAGLADDADWVARAFAMLRRAPRSAVLTDATAAMVIRPTGEWRSHESRKTTLSRASTFVSARCVRCVEGPIGFYSRARALIG